MRSFVLKILIGILTIFVAVKFIPGVSLKISEEGKLKKDWQLILAIGTILGILNFFLKPILKILTLPINLLTFGFFSFIINLILIELIDILFLELKIGGLKSLFLTGLVVWAGEFLINLLK